MQNIMTEAQRANRTILLRTIFLMVLCGVVLFIPLGAKLYNIQIVMHDEYERGAVRQQTRDMVITPARGTIFDRNYKPVGVSASVETVFISPIEIKDKVPEKADLIAQKLSDILAVDRAFIEDGMAKKTQYVVIRKKIDKALADEVRQVITDNKLMGVYIEPDSKRYYPYSTFASHVIGFVGTDNQGLEGVEAVFEDTLQGTPGRIITAKDNKGASMPFQYEKYYDAQDGRSLVLTIDETIQLFLEKHLKTAYIENNVSMRAAGIVMDIKTGEVLGMSTQPEHDLNAPREIVESKFVDELAGLEGEAYSTRLRELQLYQWRNKAVNDTYEPGSTFKIITAAIALEEKVVKADDKFYCGGSITVAGWNQPISCHKKVGHGSETFVQGVQNSCNPVFVTVGQRIGNQRFYEYMKAFGFMERTGINLPGESGSIVHSWDVFKNSIVSLSAYSFGQTFKITPIQLITAVSGVANRGSLMKPHIVKEILNTQGETIETITPEVIRQVISPETSVELCEMLEAVVTGGTGKNSYVKGYRIAGKTGTSQKRDVKDADDQGRYIVSFLGFAPADDPQVAVLVLLDEPGGPTNLRTGGLMCAPAVGRIMADILPYLGIRPQYSDEEAAGIDITAPMLKNMPLSSAQEILKGKGISFQTVGDGDTVTDQIPAPGAKIPSTAEFVIYLDGTKPDESVKVPDVNGLSPEKANKAISDAGLYMRLQGAASGHETAVVAAWQDIAPGQEVAKGSVVSVEFRDVSIRD